MPITQLEATKEYQAYVRAYLHAIALGQAWMDELQREYGEESASARDDARGEITAKLAGLKRNYIEACKATEEALASARAIPERKIAYPTLENCLSHYRGLMLESTKGGKWEQ